MTKYDEEEVACREAFAEEMGLDEFPAGELEAYYESAFSNFEAGWNWGKDWKPKAAGESQREGAVI